MENTILVTHKNCMDGSACAILFLAAGGKIENLYFSSPSNAKTDEVAKDLAERIEDGENKKVVFADLSVSKDVVQDINEQRGLGFEILDHHKTALPLNGIQGCIVDQSRAGGWMMYDWLTEKGYNLENYGH